MPGVLIVEAMAQAGGIMIAGQRRRQAAGLALIAADRRRQAPPAGRPRRSAPAGGRPGRPDQASIAASSRRSPRSADQVAAEAKIRFVIVDAQRRRVSQGSTGPRHGPLGPGQADRTRRRCWSRRILMDSEEPIPHGHSDRRHGLRRSPGRARRRRRDRAVLRHRPRRQDRPGHPADRPRLPPRA